MSASARYDALPESIKRSYTYDEWAWLSDEQKDRLELSETEPEWEE